MLKRLDVVLLEVAGRNSQYRSGCLHIIMSYLEAGFFHKNPKSLSRRGVDPAPNLPTPTEGGTCTDQGEWRGGFDCVTFKG
jgi:hypothetical protein